MEKLVSIIIPVYNLETLIDKCLKSIVNQTYKKLEIIVINDGSKDKSEKIIKEYEKKDKRIVYISKENGGQASARNMGIKKSTGDYIMFVDGDDWIEKNMVEDMMKYMTKDVELVLSDFFIDYPTKTEIGKTMPNYTKNRKNNLILSSCGPCFKIYKSQIIKKISPFFPEGMIFEDLAIIPYVNSLIKNYVYLEKPYYHYYIRENSTMQNTTFNQKQYDIFKALDNLNNNFGKKFNEELEFLYIRELLLYSYIRNFKYNTEEAKVFKKLIKKYINENISNYKKNSYYKNLNKRIKIRTWLVMNNIEFPISLFTKMKEVLKR